MGITNSIIKTVLSYFGVDEKEAEIIKSIIDQFDFVENDKQITVSCKKGFKITIDK